MITYWSNKYQYPYVGDQQFGDLVATDAQIAAYEAANAPVPSCQLWQLQAVLTPTQWSAVSNAIASANNAALTAFFSHGNNSIPANSTTLINLGNQIGLTNTEITALVTQASQIVIP